MATFKVCVFRNHLRKDGTYNVKLRITHNCQTRKISTPFYVEEENLSPDLQITDDELVDLCEDLCHECRRITRESGYKINGMTIDELVRYLIQWTIYDIYQAGPSQRSSNRLRAKTSKGSPKPRALSLYLACM